MCLAFVWQGLHSAAPRAIVSLRFRHSHYSRTHGTKASPQTRLRFGGFALQVHRFLCRLRRRRNEQVRLARSLINTATGNVKIVGVQFDPDALTA